MADKKFIQVMPVNEHSQGKDSNGPLLNHEHVLFFVLKVGKE